MSSSLAGAAGSPPRPTAAIGRRTFLRAAAVGAVAVGGAAVAGWHLFGQQIGWWRRRAENYAAAYSWAWLPTEERILRHYSYLTLDRRDVQRFVRDFERRYGRIRARDLSANRILYTKFLMSTDFFLHGGDESRPVRYVTLHDQYAAPCWNPLVPVAGQVA